MTNLLIKIAAIIMVAALPLVAAQKSDKEQKLGVDPQETRNICLLRAVKAGELNRIKDLLSQKADINCMDKHGYTPLKIAASENHQEVSALLLAAGADDTLANFHWLCDEDSMLLATRKQSLIKTYKHYLKDVRHQIFQSNTGLPDVVINIITDKMWITDADRELGVALRNGKKDEAQKLLAAGADPNFCGYRGPAVYLAAYCQTKVLPDTGDARIMKMFFDEQLGVMKLVLDKGANPNQKTFGGNPVLCILAEHNAADHVKLLLEHNADITLVDSNNKKNFLDYAADHPEVMQVYRDVVCDSVHKSFFDSPQKHLCKIVADYI